MCTTVVVSAVAVVDALILLLSPLDVSPWMVALEVSLLLPLLVVHRWPFWAGVCMLPAQVVCEVVAANGAFAHIDTLATRFALVAATCFVFLLAPLWQVRATLAVFVVVFPAVQWLHGRGFASDGVLYLALYVLVMAIGWAGRQTKAAAHALMDRTQALEREQAQVALRATAEERARLARELHDVVAHHLSVIVVQAEAGPVHVERDPARAEVAFEAISRTGKEALTELRRILGVLREGQAARAPQQGLAALPGLLDRVRAAGLAVDLDAPDELDDLPTPVDLAAHRILTEALTNTIRHAGATGVEVRIRRTEGELVLVVTDQGRKGDGTEVGEGSALPEGGQGLAGIRERARLLGGTCTAGPREDGPGWRVAVTLPLEPVGVDA